jgi:hypothetical protein
MSTAIISAMVALLLREILGLVVARVLLWQARQFAASIASQTDTPLESVEFSVKRAGRVEILCKFAHKSRRKR